jgi:hypothetical protein
MKLYNRLLSFAGAMVAIRIGSGMRPLEYGPNRETQKGMDILVCNTIRMEG